MGLLETSWALSFVIAMPIAALLIRSTTWRTPFLVTGVAAMAVAAVVHTRLPRVAGGHHPSTRLRWSRSIRAGLAAIICIGIAHSMLLVTFAAWLEDRHDLSVSALGVTAIVIGLAELGGSGGSATFGDRIGLTRAVETTLGAAVVVSALLPFGSESLPGAFVVMAAYFVVVEFAIVALLSLFTELDPRARGAVVGVFFGGFAAGHALGAVLGAELYSRFGMTENALAMAAVFAAAFLVVRLFVDEPATAMQAEEAS